MLPFLDPSLVDLSKKIFRILNNYSTDSLIIKKIFIIFVDLSSVVTYNRYEYLYKKLMEELL